MKIRITALIFSVVMLAGLLSGCSCEHEWADATCLTPKTCNLCQETEGEALGHTWAEVTCAAPKTCTSCGETEGEALPHTWVEANYQDPKTCAGCSVTEGKPLPADFEVHGLSCNLTENYKMLYITRCYDDPSKETKAELKMYNYCVFEFDETHPAKEGYEWRKVTAQIYFTDENAYKYGFHVRGDIADFYTIKQHDDSLVELDDGSTEYVVNFHGTEYPCKAIIEGVTTSGWVNRTNIWAATFYFHIPVGYDGTVIGFYDTVIEQEDGMYIYDIADENALFFRLD